MGKLFIGVPHAGNGITFHIFYPADMRIYRPIDEYRIRTDKGWIGPETFSLEISGVYKASPGAPDSNFTENFLCDETQDGGFRFTRVK